jgi:hypothetical protein
MADLKSPDIVHDGDDSDFSDDEENFVSKSSWSNSGTAKQPESDSGEDADAPENLVRQENRAVTVVRVVVFLVLLGAAVVASTFIYIFTKKSEQDAFESDFSGMANSIVSSLSGDSISLKFWMARTLAQTVSLAMATTGTNKLNLTLPNDKWDSITQEIRFVGNAALSAWSPLLFSQEEREAFEMHATSEMDKMTGMGPNPICYVCGSPDKEIKNRDTEVDLIGFGVYRKYYCPRLPTKRIFCVL